MFVNILVCPITVPSARVAVKSELLFNNTVVVLRLIAPAPVNDCDAKEILLLTTTGGVIVITPVPFAPKLKPTLVSSPVASKTGLLLDAELVILKWFTAEDVAGTSITSALLASFILVVILGSSDSR